MSARHPAVGRAMWRETLVEGAIFRESLLNLGRRDARARTAHFHCETALRLDAAGLASGMQFELPVTQEHIGDMLGLTAVHINRSLRALNDSGMIARNQRTVIIQDWKRLAKAGDFNPAYLYLRRTAPTAGGSVSYSGKDTAPALA